MLRLKEGDSVQLERFQGVLEARVVQVDCSMVKVRILISTRVHCVNVGYTVIREIFVFGNFRVINFCVRVFLWSVATTKIFQQRKFFA